MEPGFFERDMRFKNVKFPPHPPFPPVAEERKYMSISFNSISENDALLLLSFVNDYLERIGYTVYYSDPINPDEDDE